MPVVLELRVLVEEQQRHLIIEAVNNTADAQTLVAHPRYVSVEIENVHGQFVRGLPVDGRSTKSELPASADYLTAEKGARVELLRLYLASKIGESDHPELIIGGERFLDPPAKPRIRATYKATDRLMPNIPRNRQRSFYTGPADGISEPVEPLA